MVYLNLKTKYLLYMYQQTYNCCKKQSNSKLLRPHKIVPIHHLLILSPKRHKVVYFHCHPHLTMLSFVKFLLCLTSHKKLLVLKCIVDFSNTNITLQITHQVATSNKKECKANTPDEVHLLTIITGG